MTLIKIIRNLVGGGIMEKIVKKIVDELITAVDISEKVDGKEESEKLIYAFVNQYVERLITKALTEKSNKKNLTKKEQYEFAYDNFSGMKRLIQISISDAFSLAMFKYSGKSINYFTDILPVQDPENSLKS